MMMRAITLLTLLFSPFVAGATDWLMAVRSPEVEAGRKLEVELVRPDLNSPWPDQLILDMAGQDVVFSQVRAENQFRRVYNGHVPASALGPVTLRAVGLEANAILLAIRPAQTMAADSTPEVVDEVGTAASSDVDLGLAGITLNEPSYFILGAKDGMDARFQYSFKYQLFDPLGPVAQAFSPLGEIYVGYTQTSLWDLSSDSKPFRDNSYRPSLFWQKTNAGKGLMPETWRVGYEHESNGRSGTDSRSIDTLFVQPEWRHHYDARHTLAVAPKVYVYLDKHENKDIQDYRGYADLNLRYGDDDGLLLSTLLRMGTSGKGSAQADVTWPFKRPILGKVGGFFHTQVFTGYGQTLLDYNQNADTQIRFGISLVR
jgi:outer membrane phospholipase A